MATTRIAAAMVAAGLLGVGLAGCSVKVETNKTPSLDSAEVQKELTDRLTKAGNSPQSVTCADSLVGEVGKTATCTVAMSETNTVQAILTVTKVDGDTISYDVAPALTKEQLQKIVTAMVSGESANCEAGLDGKVGATTNCAITKDGTTQEAPVSVTKIEGGLSMDLSVG